ncbi:hypothetical protein, partial [Ralstonia pickettii]|uniref:hypothetical protein n=1 Tax=Ralstonia pickettii TaxID=329 RepID=UPI001C12A34D
RNGHRDHLRYNLLTAQYHLPSLITFAETADHLHRNPQAGMCSFYCESVSTAFAWFSILKWGIGL